MDNSQEKFSQCFERFNRMAFRLQLRDVYIVEDEQEEFGRFTAGDPKPSHDGDPWLAEIASAVQAGKRMVNIHIVSRCLTPYVRYATEWWYVDRAAAGEEIRFLFREDLEYPSQLGSDDFWLFDGQNLVVMQYDLEGNYIGPKIVDDPVTVASYYKRQNLALEKSMPFREFCASAMPHLTMS